MHCLTCGSSVIQSQPFTVSCPNCAAPLPFTTTRREFLIRAGLLSGALLGGPALLSACMPAPAPHPTPTPNPFGITWELANPYGIQLDDQGSLWNAGHLTDALEISDETGVIVASQTSGVWLLTDSGAGAIALSRDWDSPDITSLARGPNGATHFYAGGLSHTSIAPGDSYSPNAGQVDSSSQGALYMTDTSAGAPLVAPWLIVPVPGVGAIRKIVITDEQAPRIILATSNGVWWAPIPKTSGSTAYNWQKASGFPLPTGDIYSVALGPQQTIMATAWPHQGSDEVAGHWGLFRGSWQASSALTFQQITDVSNVDGGPLLLLPMQAISVASCVNNLNVMYAAAANPDGTLYAVMRSDDGGLHWKGLPLLVNGTPNGIYDVAGDQGNAWNNCIAVSPTDANTVAIGWQHGPFLSNDGGLTCASLEGVSGMHDDHHAITFTPSSQTSGGRMYVCCDGGLVVSSDNGASFSTSFNQKLANLQFLGPTAKREWPGGLGSDSNLGLLGGGLQDNAEVYTPLSPPASGPQPWRRLDAGDGRWLAFLANGVALHFTNDNSIRYARWNGATLDDHGVVQVRTSGPSKPASDGGIYAGVYVVESPQYVRGAGDRLYAIGATDSDIYGLFDDGFGPHWDYLLSVPVNTTKDPQGQIVINQGISAVASYSGAIMQIGLWGKNGAPGGVIYTYSLNNPGAGFVSLQADSGSNPYVPKIAIINESLTDGKFEAYAIRNDDSTGRLYYTPTGDRWYHVDAGLPTSIYFTLEVDRSTNPARVFVATDDAVYASKDQGTSWQNISAGLPKQPRCSDLRLVQSKDSGQRYLYLATFGWSVWQTPLR